MRYDGLSFQVLQEATHEILCIAVMRETHTAQAFKTMPAYNVRNEVAEVFF